MRISKRGMEALARASGGGDAQGRRVVWDDALPGFGVRTGAGGRLSYVAAYRIRGERRMRWATLGAWPALAPDDAREEAAAILAAARLGRDRLAEQAAERERAAQAAAEAARRAIPMADLLADWRASVAARAASRQARGERGTHEREMLRLEAKVLRPALAGQVAGGFDPRVLQAAILAQPSPSLQRSTRTAAIAFLAWAAATLERQGMPVDWARRFKVEGRPAPRDRVYTLDEAARIWVAAGSLGRRGAMVRLLLLTGARAGEAARMRWDDLRLDDATLGPHWAQPALTTKTRRAHRVPLSAPAVALLRWLPPRKGSPLVFAGRGGVVPNSLSDLRAALRRGAGLRDGTLHDFRRTVVTALGDHGVDLSVADALLNHAQAASRPGVLAVYQRSDQWQQRREAVALWARLLMEAVGRVTKPEPQAPAWGLEAPFAEARIRRKPSEAARDRP